MKRWTLTVQTHARRELVEITAQVEGLVREAGLQEGACLLYVPHTTAGCLINEAADPDVAADILDTLARLVPRQGPYRHFEGNSDAHIQATLVGGSCWVPVEGGRLALGRWQGIFFAEFDGPRRRQVWVYLFPGEKR